MKIPFLIAGPCCAESREQVLDTARSLKAYGVEAFRAGVWKPRTHPGSYEGPGAEALPWLREVKDTLGMRVCTEVVRAEHVAACLEAVLDMFWIGARTTANPFLVQEIADALKGKDVTVMVKNPVNPDLELWSGAVERLRMAGIKDIVLVHRGFTSAEPGIFRNDPVWQLAVRMRSLFPEYRMVCDPSHIAGNRTLVPQIAQKAIDLGMDGLMVEVHCNPAAALSDSSQQLSPEDFASMVNGCLKFRSSGTDNPDYNSALSSLRAQIDSLDHQILQILAQRMEASRQIGKIKKENNVSIVQAQRWNDVLELVRKESRDVDLDPDFTAALFEIIHDASIAEQNKLLFQL